MSANQVSSIRKKSGLEKNCLKEIVSAGCDEGVSILAILNAKEKQILMLSASGLCVHDICSALQLNVREVLMHRYNIKSKSKFRSYRELIKSIKARPLDCEKKPEI